MWKKSEILKNKKFRILLLLEVLLLLVPVIGILCGNKTISTLADAQVTTEEGVIREAKGYSVDGSSRQQQYQRSLAGNERFFHGTRYLLLLCDV